jgi:hypothetical protein
VRSSRGACSASAAPRSWRSPLVGTDDEVRGKARGWRRRLLATTTLGEERSEADRVFLLLLGDRFRPAGLVKILGKESFVRMEKTALGRALIANVEARGLARGKAEGKAEGLRRAVEIVLRARFGRVPRTVSGKLRTMSDPARLELLASEVSKAGSLAEVAALLR